MKEKEAAVERLPIWKGVLAVFMAIIAALLLICGSVALIAKDTISERMINNVLSDVDLWEEYGEAATEAINCGIAHLAGEPYMKEGFVTEDELAQVLDVSAIKTFIANKAAEFSAAVSSDRAAALEASELVPLLEPVRNIVRDQYGIEASTEDICKEIADALGEERYEWSADSRILYPGGARTCCIIGAVLLLGIYVFTWSRVNYASILCLISCIVLFFVLWGIGTFSGGIAYSIGLPSDEIIACWSNKVSELFVRRARLSLLGCIPPAAALLFCAFDRKHVNRILRNR